MHLLTDSPIDLLDIVKILIYLTLAILLIDLLFSSWRRK